MTDRVTAFANAKENNDEGMQKQIGAHGGSSDHPRGSGVDETTQRADEESRQGQCREHRGLGGLSHRAGRRERKIKEETRQRNPALGDSTETTADELQPVRPTGSIEELLRRYAAAICLEPLCRRVDEALSHKAGGDPDVEAFRQGDAERILAVCRRVVLQNDAGDFSCFGFLVFHVAVQTHQASRISVALPTFPVSPSATRPHHHLCGSDLGFPQEGLVGWHNLREKSPGKDSTGHNRDDSGEQENQADHDVMPGPHPWLFTLLRDSPDDVRPDEEIVERLPGAAVADDEVGEGEEETKDGHRPKNPERRLEIPQRNERAVKKAGNQEDAGASNDLVSPSSAPAREVTLIPRALLPRVWPPQRRLLSGTK